MINHVIALLTLFRGRVPDPEINAWVLELASNKKNWPGAHNLFSKVRGRNLVAIEAKDQLREAQYCFEEVCLKAIYNESHSSAPFDSDSPYWIAPLAIELSRLLGMPDSAVIDIVAPRH